MEVLGAGRGVHGRRARTAPCVFARRARVPHGCARTASTTHACHACACTRNPPGARAHGGAAAQPARTCPCTHARTGTHSRAQEDYFRDITPEDLQLLLPHCLDPLQDEALYVPFLGREAQPDGAEDKPAQAPGTGGRKAAKQAQAQAQQWAGLQDADDALEVGGVGGGGVRVVGARMRAARHARVREARQARASSTCGHAALAPCLPHAHARRGAAAAWATGGASPRRMW